MRAFLLTKTHGHASFFTALGACSAALVLLLLLVPASARSADDDREVRRWVGMITWAVQEYSEGVVDGRIVDAAELGVAEQILLQMRAEAPSPELDVITALVADRVPIEQIREAAGLWFETHAIGVEPERPTEPPSIASGARLFARYCTSCHGALADGRGALAEHVEGPEPADFTDVAFMSGETLEEFFQAITLGVPGSAMPAWGEILGERDRWDLVAFLWSLRGSDGAADSVTSKLTVCAGCHGDSGSAPNLTQPGAMADSSDAQLAERARASARHGETDATRLPALVALARRLSVIEQRSGDDSRRVDPRHVALALRLIVEEYVDAVRDGKVVDEVEYGEARLFHSRLVADLEQLTADGVLADNQRAGALAETLGQAILMRESADVVETRALELAEAVLPELGVELEDEQGGAIEAVTRTIERARRTAATEPQRAARLLLDAYLQFEPVERRLGARDPALVGRIEREFSRLRGELGAGRNDAEGFETLLASLDDARNAAAAPKDWTAIFIASLLIILREGLEVILIVSALAAYLAKGGHTAALRWLYGGAGVGVVISIITAFALDVLLDNVAVGQEILEGITMLVAAAVLFSVSYWLISKVEARHWQNYIQRSLNHALGRGSNFAMAGVSFLAVYREGFETVLFYRALAVDSAFSPLAIGFAVGLAALAALWVAISWFSLRIPLKQFFGLTGALLYLLAFRFIGAGIGELQEAGVVTITPIAWWPDLSTLGMAANLETAMAQVILVVAAAIAGALLATGRSDSLA